MAPAWARPSAASRSCNRLSALIQGASANPALQLYRSVFERRIAAVFPSRARVLDLAGSFDGIGAVGPCDGAYAGPGVLDGTDLVELGAALAGCLQPDARVVLCLPGRVPLPALLQRALRGKRRWRRGYSMGDAAWALGPEFAWDTWFALGVLVPGAAQREWIVEHPQAFGALAAIESPLRAWPVVRGLGEYTVLDGRRR